MSRRITLNTASCFFPLIETRLHDWLCEKREEKICVDEKMIKVEALRLKVELYPNSPFSASCGWLEGFLKRHHWAIRRVTTSGRDIQVDFEKRVRAFLDSCAYFRQPEFYRSSFLNMDQTSIYLDPNLTRTFAERGSRRVEAVTAGQEKTRVSVALTASAAGD